MPQIEWVQAEWLYALPAVPLLVWLLLRGNPSPWRRLIDRHLLNAMMRRTGQGGQRFGAWLAGLIAALSIFMLAGPSVHSHSIPLLQRSDILAVALDMSDSMNAVDPKPSRLAYATYKIQDALDIHSGEAMLVVWSGAAHLVIPPTHDRQTIVNALKVLQTGLLPVAGDRPAEAVELVQQHIPRELQAASRILLVTDGSGPDALEQLQGALAGSPLRASILVMGSRDGGPVLRPGGRLSGGAGGQPQFHIPDFTPLQRMAQSAGARIAQMSTRNNSDLAALLDEVSEVSGSEQQWRVLTEVAPLALPLLALLFAVLIAWGRVPGLMLALCLLPLSALSLGKDSSWLNDDRNAWNRLKGGDAAGAALLFGDSEWQAYSHHRSGNHQEAARIFSEQDGVRSQYNLGTTLAFVGDFERAIETLEHVLELEPGHEDARHNLEVLRRLQEQQQQDQQQSQGRDGDDSQQESANSGEQGQQQEEQQDAQQQEQQGESGEQSESQQGQEEQQSQERQRAAQAGQPQEGEEQTDEQQQAQATALEELEGEQQAVPMEYVEPDPGGLLRRRFLDQSKRR